MEQLRIKCPNLTCRKILAVPGNSRGKNVRCKNCGATIRVPDRAAASSPPKAAGAAARATDPKKPEPAAEPSKAA